MLEIYWNLAYVIFQISRYQFWCYKICLFCLAQIGPKIKSDQNLLKFGTFGIWNLPILILMSKMVFDKYFPPVRPKLIPKLKMLRIYWNLTHLIFRISWSLFWCQKWFSLNIYHLLGPNWSNIKNVQNLLKLDISHFCYTDLDLMSK